jgi:hypothetical protein
MHIVKLIACIVMGIASITLARAREPVAIDRAADSPLTNSSPLEIMGRILPALERKIESRCALLIVETRLATHRAFPLKLNADDYLEILKRTYLNPGFLQEEVAKLAREINGCMLEGLLPDEIESDLVAFHLSEDSNNRSEAISMLTLNQRFKDNSFDLVIRSLMSKEEKEDFYFYCAHFKSILMTEFSSYVKSKSLAMNPILLATIQKAEEKRKECNYCGRSLEPQSAISTNGVMVTNVLAVGFKDVARPRTNTEAIK